MQNRGLKLENWNNTKALITVYGVASGMSYLHSKNILHRDLKPANIFYDDYLFPKIGDFGLSKEANSEELEDISPYLVGTPAFMSPEILYQNKYCKASDVYLFGILLFQMTTGQNPYDGLNFYQVGPLVARGIRPKFETEIPDCYRKLIEQCWAGKEEDRPTFDQIVDLLENDDDFIYNGIDKINEVNIDEFFNYIDYVKSNKINDSFKSVTVDFEELKRIQENDPTLNISFLELNQYERIKVIKRLDNFKVYEVVNKETNQHCEAKVSTIKITRLSQKELIHLQREINILSKLNHPSFLKFIGYSPIDFNQQPNPIIVTEMPPNRSLNDLLDVERNCGEEENHVDEWTETKKLINIYGIASGMAYLHSNNVIHRNLNPDSIFLDDYLFPKIGNFGLLTKIHTIKSMTFQTTIGIKGNPSYSAPELLMLNEYSKKSDVYAFALIIYEIMTLKVPFSNITNFNILFNEIVTKSNRPKLDDKNIPDCYRQLIELCWSQNPEERPSFEEITSLLKNDNDFITKDVNKEEFNEYVELIEKSKIDFYSENRVVKFDDIIQNKKRDHEEEKQRQQEQKSKSKSKTKTKIAPKIKQINKDDDDDDEELIHYHNKSRNKNDKTKSKNVDLIELKTKNFVNEFDSIYDDLYNKKFIGSIQKEVNDYLLQNSNEISTSSISTDYKVIIGKSTSDKDFILIKSIEREGFKKENINEINSEYKIINELNHPNIVKSLGYYTSKNNESTSSILFEFYSRKLKNVIESIEDVYLITLIYEIAHAMNEVHSKKIIHRNLNIENIFVDLENHAKIAEFENSILMSVKEQINNSKEKPFFISRELLNNEKFDEKVDVFSFGVIMEFILRRGKGSFIKKQDIIDGKKAKIPKSINKLSFSIILKCLSHSPKERPSFNAIIKTIKKFKFNLIDGIEEKIPIIEKQLKAIIDKKHSK